EGAKTNIHKLIPSLAESMDSFGKRIIKASKITKIYFKNKLLFLLIKNIRSIILITANNI
ncbi:MAG TPA: hypothetical protein DEF85_02195, partial [Clostridiaceae bacterium]|nr:hypothetical protein [Clostridiaceae bacterium]